MQTCLDSLDAMQELRRDPKAEKELKLEVLAEVSGVWTTNDPEALSSLDELHIWSQQYVENRLSWRAKQPLTILELRCSHLKPPLVVPNADMLWGCFSFAELEDVAFDGLLPSQLVLEDETFKKQQRALRERLARFGLEDVRSSEALKQQ